MNNTVLNFREKLDNINLTDYHGLKSPGLTCYLNSVLQVLFMTEDFREAIEGSHREDLTTLDLQLQKLFKDLKTKRTETNNVTTQLGITNVYEQHDAAEYFEKVLHLTSPEASKIFKGELNHKTRCLQCGKSNDSRSFFWMLPLVVEDSHHQTHSVEHGLETFFKGETVSEDNRMYCNQCYEKREAEITCDITHNPEVLTLLLKRFRFDNKRKCYVKLHSKVEVPQALHSELFSCPYDLYALVNHYGNLAGGHYTAEIKSFETGVWYCFNDDTVTMQSQPLFGKGNTSVRSCTAYLLMYRKRNTYSENSEEDEHEAKSAYSDVGAEGRFEEAARGEDCVPHHQLKEEQNNKGRNLTFNGDISQKIHDNKVRMKHKHSGGEVEKLPKGRVTRHVTTCEVFGNSYLTQKLKSSTDEEQHKPKRQQHDRNSKALMSNVTTRGPPTEVWIAHHNNRRFDQTLNFLEERVTVNTPIWEGQDNGCSPSSPPTGARCSHSGCVVHEPFVYNLPPSIYKGNDRQRTKEMQHFVEATQGGKTTNLRKPSKNKNNSEDNLQRPPWR
ncbi:Ubiquitin carboxyl-terminal hydrolase 47 [Channa argus]|uniref:Ubiquitin carboxyl-terminal hydrolase 47 n=1 Tax=Channa argus TaxID=215402 RepID=A0A6G1Q666_CHAAH|nr:Ubiquitin carboxyl-terminal hydrolase 47 [Channa argus]